MKPLHRSILTFLLCFCFTCHSLRAQETMPRVSITVSDATVPAFTKELEKQTGYYFYYDISRFDSLRINITADRVLLPAVLQQAFSGTGFHFSIDGQRKYIFLTRTANLQTSLPAGFSSKQAAGGEDRNALPEYGDIRKKRMDASLENKLFEIGPRSNDIGTGNVTLAGYVRNVKTGEPVAGASIFVKNSNTGTATDQYGYYSLTLPKGRQTIMLQGIGMSNTSRQLMLYTSGRFDIEMDERVISLKEVIVSAQKLANVKNVQMGTERLNIKAIKQLPAVFGEADILKAVLTLPGVKTVGEASTGFNVRGGSADQNLILFNDVTIFNPSHFFGFFSAFNPDVVKELELYKSSIPAKFGGRLSSVLDISSREGNKKEFAGSAGIGLLTSRFNLEGPIKKETTSFILGARTTYANWLLNKLPDEYKNSRASFYDINLNISHQFNEKNTLFLTGYLSRDRFNLNNDTSYEYSNRNVSIKWKHIFSNKVTGTATAGYDSYEYSISSSANKVKAYKLAFDINQLNFKTDFNWYYNAKHTISFGGSTIHYLLHPGQYGPNDPESLITAEEVEREKARESALYISDQWDVSNELSIQAGIRYSMFNYLGSQQVNIYAEGLPKEEENLLETRTYGNGDIIKTYHGPELRFSVRYLITPSFSVKAGYNTLRQYIHMLSNTTAISPTDIWKLSDMNILPQQGQQVSLGFYKNFKSNTIETSVEVYYKKIKDYLDYKSGAQLVLNNAIERDVINTKGKAYGAEFMIKKQLGKLNGWISYTYSRILLTMDDPSSGELINGGREYPASYDKPHDVTLAGNYRFSHRFSISMNATYSTGRPITIPIGRYYYGGSLRALYSDRNAYRIPDYFRMDFSMNIEGNHKVHQRFHNSWTIGLYNLTGRKNPYSVYFVSENGVINGYKLSIFGNIIPFVNFNIRF